MQHLDILVLEGDGIGPEVVEEAVAVLTWAAQMTPFSMTLTYAPFGGAAIDDGGVPVTPATLDLAQAADAVILGAVGGPKWDDLPPSRRPERALLELREAMGVYANLRPARIYPALADASPLKRAGESPVDFMVVRELLGGVYYGEPRGRTANGRRSAVNTMTYDEAEIRRVAAVAFDLARDRRGRLVSVDKANVLEVSMLWREVVRELAAVNPDVDVSHMYVDNCAMQLILDPGQFDVVLTENLFGDILSDAAAAVVGSIGLLPSASLGEGPALYEPIHGSAPALAGTGRANPIAAIRSVAMLVEHTVGHVALARFIEDAVDRALGRGMRPEDLRPRNGQLRPALTREMGRAVLDELEGFGPFFSAAW